MKPHHQRHSSLLEKKAMLADSIRKSTNLPSSATRKNHQSKKASNYSKPSLIPRSGQDLSK